MKHCTIYASSKDCPKIAASIQNAFKDKKVEISDNKGKIVVTYKKLFGSFSINFSLMTRDREPENFENMMEGMYGYFHQIQTGHQNIKDQLLTQIKFLNTCIGIVCEKEMDNDIYRRILTAVAEIDAILFIPAGAMVDKNGKVILNTAGESQVEEFIVTASSDLLDDQVRATDSGEERKKRSIELLKQKDIPYIEHLPVIVGDEDVVIRSKEEVAKRAVALSLIVTYASELANDGQIEENREFLNSLIERFGAKEFFTEAEKSFINDNNPDKVTVTQFAWQYECLWVLLWALGYVKELNFPADICDVQAAIGFLKDAGSFKNFVSKASLREKEDILDQADLIYRYDWACVDARIKKQPAPGGLNDEVVVERHRSLNWLICYMDADWDDVATNT